MGGHWTVFQNSNTAHTAARSKRTPTRGYVQITGFELQISGSQVPNYRFFLFSSVPESDPNPVRALPLFSMGFPFRKYAETENTGRLPRFPDLTF